MIFNKALLLIASALIISSSCNVGSKMDTSQKSEPIILMTYNIRHGAPLHKSMDFVDLDGITETIKKANPDIVVLQELDSMTQRAPLDEMKILGEKLGMDQVFFRAIDYQTGKYGLGLLSKFPIKHTQLIKLPMPESGEPRILGVATIEPSPGHKVNIGITHLDFGARVENRRAQIAEIVKFSKESEFPLILGGDFNDQIDSDVMKEIREEFTLSCTDCPFTYPSDIPDQTIDYILLNPEAASIFGLGTVKTVQSLASDHLPVIVELNRK